MLSDNQRGSAISARRPGSSGSQPGHRPVGIEKRGKQGHLRQEQAGSKVSSASVARKAPVCQAVSHPSAVAWRASTAIPNRYDPWRFAQIASSATTASQTRQPGFSRPTRPRIPSRSVCRSRHVKTQMRSAKQSCPNTSPLAYRSNVAPTRSVTASPAIVRHAPGLLVENSCQDEQIGQHQGGEEVGHRPWAPHRSARP